MLGHRVEHASSALYSREMEGSGDAGHVPRVQILPVRGSRDDSASDTSVPAHTIDTLNTHLRARAGMTPLRNQSEAPSP